MSKCIRAALALAVTAIAATACSEAPEQEAQTAPEAPDGIAVTNGRLMLPAVAGNPGAVYFDLAYDGDRSVALNRAHVEGAESATLHEYAEWNRQMQMAEMLPLVLKKGDTLAFEPGGKHVMAMGVSPELQPGGTTEVTLIVSGGDKTTFEAEIRGPGEER